MSAGYWLGGYQPTASDGADGWVWVTGELWSYTKWDVDEPNNVDVEQFGYEDALISWFDGWNDAPSGKEYPGYVVEYGCQQVEIDIKPGSDPNCFNSDGHGVIPVAILTTETFDASTVDPATVELDGAGVRVEGNSGKSGSLEDVDGDGDLDLVVQIEDIDGTYTASDETASLTGQTYDGDTISATDSICIVPNN